MLRETKLENRNHFIYQNWDEKKYLKNYTKRIIQKKEKHGGAFKKQKSTYTSKK